MFPPGSLFLPSHPPHVLQRLLSHLVLLVLSCPREREARTMGFIVFELGASLLCFVSRAIRGANCRSYAIAFCFLLLPPSLHALSPSLSLCLYSLAPAQPPSVHVFLSFLASTPTDTTDHEGGLLSHSPLSSSSRGARSSLSNASPVPIALPLVALLSQPTSSVAALRTCHSVPFPSPFLVRAIGFCVASSSSSFAFSSRERARLVSSRLTSINAGPRGPCESKNGKRGCEEESKGTF